LSEQITIYLIIGFLVVCAIADIKSSKIPNILTLPFALSGVVYHCTIKGVDGAVFSLGGMISGVGLLLIPYLMRGMGAGDVKLMGAVGSFLGAKATVAAFFYIAIAGGVYSLAVILVQRDLFHGFFKDKLQLFYSMMLLKQYMPLHNTAIQRRVRLKYGVAIAVGTITYLIARSYDFTLFS
jgi:prepilin peptidase CpaA